MTRYPTLLGASIAALCIACTAPTDPAATTEETTATESAPTDIAAIDEAPVFGGIVSAASPDAVEAGLKALRAGGDAVDAAIAIQAALSLVEPQSSGIGGGAFMLRYDAETGAITVYDGRERAPATATPELFLDENGEPLGFIEAWRSGLSTGAPGAIAMLAMAHEDHGALSWAENFEYSIDLARNGFEVQPRLSMSSARMAEFTDIEEVGAAASYLFDENGQAWPVGHTLTNEDYAVTLEAIAADYRNFYTGEIAEAIVAAVAEAPRPGTLSLEDLANYEPQRREPVCAPYRGLSVCSAPPPSSGGIAVNAILGILENFDMSQYNAESVDGWALFIEASRLAYADRDHYVGDTEFVDVPVEGMIDRAYLADRAGLVDLANPIDAVTHGTPPGAPDQPADTTDDQPGTTHFVVVDADGDVISMTTTVESIFGSGRLVKGFFLNNQLTDFARDPRDETGRLLPNAAEPRKRPRSSMSPTIVLDEDGAFKIATGSPGGNSIIAYTAKSLVAMIDWGMHPQAAAALPNIVARGDTINIETGFDEDMLAELEARGFSVRGNRGENSGIHIAMIDENGELIGAADPRRDGYAGTP